MIKNIGKRCNASDSYKKVEYNHIVQKQLPIITVINKVMTQNISWVNQVSTAKIRRQLDQRVFAIIILKWESLLQYWIPEFKILIMKTPS